MAKSLLNLRQLQEALAKRDDGALAVGLFIHFASNSQDEWMDVLARHLRDAGILSAGLITPGSRTLCHLEAPDMVALVEPDDLISIRGLDAFIISDMDHSSAHFPQNTPVIGCAHNSFVNPGNGLPSCIGYSALMDAWLVPAPITGAARRNIVRLWSGMARVPTSRRQGRHFHIIPLGSLRLAALREKMRPFPADGTIVYAPTGRNLNPGRGGQRLREHGGRIIATLLAAFPLVKVMFRPYRGDLESEDVRRICAEFAANDRFSLDREAGRAEAFSQATIIITDFSHVGASFNLAAGRPSIYFEPWLNAEKRLEKRDGNFWCNTYEGLVEAVSSCFANLESLSCEIRAKMAASSLPVDNVFSQLAEVVSDLVEGVTRDEWLTICRPENLPDDDEELRLVQRILSQPQDYMANMAVAAATYAHPGSPLLAALALHQCLALCPEAMFFQPFRLALEKHIKSERQLYRYKHVEIGDVRRLYERALASALRKKDTPRRQFIEKMLEAVGLLEAEAPF